MPMNEILDNNTAFISRREDQLFNQITSLENENVNLSTAYSELKNQCTIILEEKSSEIMLLKRQLNDAVSTLTSVESEILYKNKELETWKINATTKLVETLGTEDFEAEINKVQDPNSFNILKGLQIELKRANDAIKLLQLNQNLELREENKRQETKVKKLFGEWKYQKSQCEKLKTQNDFCLGELEHTQRKVDRLQNELQKVTGKNYEADFPDTSQKYEEIIKDVCDILKVENENDLVKSVQAIEQAYQYLPSLQSTVEQLYASVQKNNIFNAQLDSYTDITSCIENWAVNLHDYKHLVEGLLEVLKINDDTDRTVSFILENVRVLCRKEELGELDKPPMTSGNRGIFSSRDEENFLTACTLLNHDNSDDFVYALKDLIDKAAFQNEFLEGVKRRLAMSSSTNDEDLITTQSKIVNLYIEESRPSES